MRLALLFPLLTTLLGITLGTASAEPDPHFHLYLLIGQSNMAGRGIVDEESSRTDPRITMLTRSLQWEPAKDPLHFDKPSAGVGPGLGFAKAMAAQNPEARIGLVPCAVGGTSIRAWSPGQEDRATKTHPYDDMLARITEAQKVGVLRGILWNQGEADRNHPAGYTERLVSLIQRLRAELGTEAPFIAAELPTWNPADAPANEAFNAALRTVGQSVPNFVCISPEGLSDKGDKLHYDAASARILGTRYAEALQKILR